MSETTYTYSVADDTVNGTLDSDGLAEEIATASLGQSLVRIDRSGDVLDITFANALNSQQALDTVVNNHSAAGPTSYVSSVTNPHGRIETVHVRTQTVETATPKVLYTLSLGQDEVAVIDLIILARRDDGAGVGKFCRHILVSRDGSGAPTEDLLDTIGLDKAPALSGWAVDTNISGNDVRVRFTGNATHTVTVKVFGTSHVMSA